jgi:DNA-binding MarR family transcriptional regulator
MWGEMTLASLQVLLTVAWRPDLSITQIARGYDLSQAGASRILDALGDRDRRGEPGLGLVEAVGDREDRRKRLYRLLRRARSQ